MDWLLDRRDPGSVHGTLEGVERYLHRHAAPGARVDAAMAAVRTVLEDERGLDAEVPLWLSLDWRGEKPQLAVTELTDGPDIEQAGLSTGTALVPGSVDALARTGSRLLGGATLDLERRVHETYAEGPPPVVSVEADPRRQGVSSVAVALTAAAEAHPSANAAQLATLAGAVLAGNVGSDSAPASGREAATVVAQAHQALGSEVQVLAADDGCVDLVITRCPFAPGIAENDTLCHVSTGLAGQLGARVHGAAVVVLSESIAAGDPACRLHMRLDGDAPEERRERRAEGRAGVRGELHRWPPVAAGHSRGAPHLELSVNLPSETESVPVVRRLGAQALRSFGVTERDVGDVQLAIGEACANVIKHAIDSDTYEVRVELAADQCTITVVDQGSGFDATAVPENPDPQSQGGRGLALMRALTDKVAFVNHPQAGTVVHMTKQLVHDESHPLWKRASGTG